MIPAILNFYADSSNRTVIENEIDSTRMLWCQKSHIYCCLSVFFGCCSGVINQDSHVYLSEIMDQFTLFVF